MFETHKFCVPTTTTSGKCAGSDAGLRTTVDCALTAPIVRECQHRELTPGRPMDQAHGDPNNGAPRGVPELKDAVLADYPIMIRLDNQKELHIDYGEPAPIATGCHHWLLASVDIHDKVVSALVRAGCAGCTVCE